MLDRTEPRRPWQILVSAGRSTQRSRRLTGRTLIGTSPHCGLRISHGLPPVHSVLSPHDDGVLVEALHPEPWLIVDGQQVRTHMLHDGQTLNIAGVSVILERAADAADNSDTVAIAVAVAAEMEDAPDRVPMPPLLSAMPRRRSTLVAGLSVETVSTRPLRDAA